MEIAPVTQKSSKMKYTLYQKILVQYKAVKNLLDFAKFKYNALVDSEKTLDDEFIVEQIFCILYVIVNKHRYGYNAVLLCTFSSRST